MHEHFLLSNSHNVHVQSIQGRGEKYPMKKRFLFVVLLSFALIVSACSPAATTPAPAAPAAEEPAAPVAEEPAAPAASGEELKVAILAPLSGPVPTFGVSTRDGALLAIEEWNAKGGVLGRQVRGIVEDSQCTADPAVNAANKVIETDGVKYIVGEVCSSASIPVSEIAEEKGIVQISPTSTNPTVTLNLDGTTKQYVFRACFIDPFQGLVMAKFALGQGHTTAFLMFDQGNDYVRGLSEAFEEAFIANGGKSLVKNPTPRMTLTSPQSSRRLLRAMPMYFGSLTTTTLSIWLALRPRKKA
jgi:branched-chain amino acid transport system substrate-binding protein